MLDKLYSMLSERGIQCIRDIPLSTRSTFRVGGVGALGVFPRNIEEFCFSIKEIKNNEKEFFVIGKGSNLIFGDGYLERIFIFTEKMQGVSTCGDLIKADAGLSLSALSSLAADNSLGGLEFAKGIPGSVGGGVFMNAGAYGSDISGVLLSSLAYDCEKDITVRIIDHNFSYRHSIYNDNKNLICLSAEFKLTPRSKDEILEKMREFTASRKEKQPLEYPSAGSYFKRPEGYFAGKLIEDCGLKGYTVGGAAVSEKHAGFIINLGSATAADILELEEIVTRTVYERFGVKLEREVRVIS